MSMPQRVFLVFLCVHFVVWALLPCLKTTMHPDSLEAINWGIIGGWVNDKHPPLSGFLANLFWQIGGRTDISIYILAQICMTITFIYVYRLGRLIFADDRRAVLSAMLLGDVLYYTMTASDQFNCNIVSVPLWAATAFYIYRGVRKGLAMDWIFAGVAIGLNMLNKYSAVFQLIGIGAYMLASGDARRQLRRPWPYVGAVIAALIFAPHAVALWQTDFISLGYLQHNAIVESPLLRFTEPLAFTLSLLAAAAMSILIYFLSVRGAPRPRLAKNRDAGIFLSLMIFVPFLAFIADPMIMNLKISTMWGIPLLLLTGTALLYFWPRQITDKVFKRAAVGVFVAMAIFAAANFGKYIFNNSSRIHFEHDKFVIALDAEWSAETDSAPLRFVRGDTWFASIISLYHSAHPRTILNIDAHYRKELNARSLDEYGILLVGVRREDVENLIRPLNQNQPILRYEYTNENFFGRGREFEMFYVIIPPARGLQ